MTDPPHPATRDPDPAARPPTQSDWRADYDDDFGRVRTPRQNARRRLLLPGIDFILLGACVVAAAAVAAIFVLIEYLEDAADPLTYLEMVGWLALTALGGSVGLVVLLGGIALLNLRRHRLALVAAYIVTSLSLASLYAILFYPFGIWALVLLHRTEVRQVFERPPGEDPRQRPTPAWAFILVGGVGLVVLTLVLALIVWDTQVGFDHWEHWELVLAFTLLAVGIAGSAAVLVYGIVRARRVSARPAGPEPSHVERPEPGPAAGPPAADV